VFEGLPGPVAIVVATVGSLMTSMLLVMAALLDRSGPIRVRHWVEKAGGRLRVLFDHSDRFESYRYSVGFLARVAPAMLLALLTWVLAPWRASFFAALLLALVVVALVVLVAETISRLLALRAEPFLDRLTFAYRGLHYLLRPVLPLVSPLFSVGNEEGAGNGEDEDEASDDEIEAYLDVGAREGILEPGEEDLIMRVIDFGDEVVKSVMTPRTDMVCAAMDTPLDDLAALFVASNHSRIPLFLSSVDDIRGVLHIRDLLGALRSPTPPSVESLSMPPLFVPETKLLAELLRELQATHKHLALVVDEYGGTAGLVTIEDLLEEIVGEIVDEHDPEEREVQRLADGSYRLDGMTSVDALGSLFGLDLEDEPYETIGGLVFGLVGDVPEPGATIVAHGLRFTVERVEDRRIDMLLVTAAPPGPVVPSS